MTTACSSTSPKPLDLSHLPENPLYGGEDAAGIGWQLSPTPFCLTEAQLARLHTLGDLLAKFMQAVDNLYRQSRNPNLPVPDWVADLYDQGKPEDLLRFSQMKRMKSQLPLVLRPDLLLNEDGWTLVEIDAVPGGIGFTSALNRFYRLNGLPVIEAKNGMPGAFLDMLKAQVPDKEAPVIAIVLSDESADYRAEMSWLVETLRAGTDIAPPYANIALLHPKDIDLVRDQLVFTDPATGEEKAIDLIYRFFELFDLPNIPKIELIQYAVKKNLVKCTPPFKPQVEEKLSLALLHHPALSGFWRQELGEDGFEQLKTWVPRGWVLDPAPLPSQAVIPDLTMSGQVVQDFRELKAASQKERELVVKPSGFSELGWGSRGVTIGHDHSAESWAERLETALASFGTTPCILQQFRPAGVQTIERLDLATGQSTPFKSRTRLCPYFFMKDGKAELVGVLATSTPADKKLIHGMKDAVLAPGMVGLT